MIVNTFMVPVYEKASGTSPYFLEKIDYSSKFMGNYYEVSVFNIDSALLNMLKDKYIWISEEKSIESN